MFKKNEKQCNNIFILTVTEEFVQIEHSKRKTEKIRWDEINEIWMVNTDEGPAIPDIWMALVGIENGCLLPTSDCDGYEQVFDVVSKYKYFNFENYIASMSCAENKKFIVWKKEWII